MRCLRMAFLYLVQCAPKPNPPRPGAKQFDPSFAECQDIYVIEVNRIDKAVNQAPCPA